ncbi:hypothetical protein ATO6_23485 [Oceanicola sp. 22II-s10i]|uniref:helix-turn-helix domain-containing protein n=1 Tax=Oceanicola sp. 22II-s10i TaxID=1317116 RepID=UPI000B526A9C|nr:helix-turn-helix domain-containing protein [Oceanicola sp. 22II-s10i]OWU81707.1 hypothetical protein ATO6_23485 [Oceanicola sp. 22II-s10i]
MGEAFAKQLGPKKDDRNPSRFSDETPGFGLPPRIIETELARYWQLSPRTLQRWRQSGIGPCWMRLGGRVLYRREDVLAWEAAHLESPSD